MTEAEWLVCSDPVPMLAFLDGRASDRKMRLLLCAVAGRMKSELVELRSWGALDLAEQYADGRVTRGECRRGEWMARDAARAVEECLFPQVQRWDWSHPRKAAASLACLAARVEPVGVDELIGEDLPWSEMDLQHLRDIFGNPASGVDFRNTGWRTCTVTALASAIYEERAFDRMPILADALEEVGCDHDDILTHCRQDGVHVRGCWVVDLVLGKT